MSIWAQKKDEYSLGETQTHVPDLYQARGQPDSPPGRLAQIVPLSDDGRECKGRLECTTRSQCFLYFRSECALRYTAPYDTSMVLLLYSTTVGNADAAPRAEL